MIKNINLNKEQIYTEAFKRGFFDFITVSEQGKHLKQQACLHHLTDPQIFDLLYGGAAGGAKSWTGCSWLLFSCLAYPGTSWFIGRKELKAIEKSTLQTFYKVAKAYGITSYKYVSGDSVIEFSNGSRIEFLQLRFLPSDELYERFGSLEFTGGWIEEAGEVNFGAYDILKTRVGRNLNDKYNLGRGKIFITCNPKKNWLFTHFYKPFVDNVLKKGQGFIQALISDNPFREKGYEENLDSISDPSKKARLKGGDWNYDEDPSVIMEYIHIINLYKNSHVQPTGTKYITADIARLGEDKTRIGVWDGLVLIKRVNLFKSRITDVATAIRQLADTHSIPMSQVVVDADGVGGGVADILGCCEMYNASAPFNGENFDNKRSQFYFKLAEMVNGDKMHLPGIAPQEQELISQELSAIKEVDKDSDGKRKVNKREAIIELIQHSPDYATMLMLRMWWVINQSTQSWNGFN